jgi:hypothetical protein
VEKKNIPVLIVIAILAIVISSIASSKIFATKHNAKAPVVQAIDSNFPDVKTDPTYQPIFNSNALDPTQLIQIGTSQNPTPFNASQ